MLWSDLLAAVALVFVLEGIVPFLSPGTYKRFMRMAGEMDESALRIIGIVSMLIGLVLLAIIR
jgi:uncharacterized protein YjeT (DUF2065 family)